MNLITFNRIRNNRTPISDVIKAAMDKTTDKNQAP